MATYSSTNPVVVGAPTKADDYDVVFDNTVAIYDSFVAHDHNGDEGESQVVTDGITDNAVTEAKIADTDLPNGFRAYASNISGLTVNTWVDSGGTGGFDNDSNFATGTYTVPSNGVYVIFAQARVEDSSSIGSITLQLKEGANVIAEDKVIGTNDAGTYYAVLQCATIEVLTASDTITTLVSGASGNLITGRENTYFYAYKLPWTTAY